VVEALGIDSEGHKRILGLWEGGTDNETVCKALLEDPVERGLLKDRAMLVVIDGSKALRKAVRGVLGDSVVVQRCRIHKMSNVLDHFPKTHLYGSSSDFEQPGLRKMPRRWIAGGLLGKEKRFRRIERYRQLP